MTKLKNTKKGMAKKALSISLVAAMLATSNVPVWAAEDLFSDGSAAVEAPVVEEPVAEVETFSAEPAAEAEAPVVEGTTNDVATYAAGQYDFSDLECKTNIEWNDTIESPVEGSIKNEDGESAENELVYVWLIDGVEVDGVAYSANVLTTGASCGITSLNLKNHIGSPLSIRFYEWIDGQRGDQVVGELNFGTIQAVTISNSDVIISGVEANYQYLGKYIEKDTIEVAPQDSDGALKSLTADDFDWSYAGSNGYNVGTVTVIGTLKSSAVTKYGYKGSISTSYNIIPRSTLTEDNLDIEVVNTDAGEYTGKNISLPTSSVSVKMNGTNETLPVKSVTTNGKLAGNKQVKIVIDVEKLKLNPNYANLTSIETITTTEDAVTISQRDLSEGTARVNITYAVGDIKNENSILPKRVTITGADGKSILADDIADCITVKVVGDIEDYNEPGTYDNAVEIKAVTGQENVIGTVYADLVIAEQSFKDNAGFDGKLGAQLTSDPSDAKELKTYTGEEIEFTKDELGRFSPDGTSTSTDQSSFTFEYDNNINASTDSSLASITVTAKEGSDYAGCSRTYYFKISPAVVKVDADAKENTVSTSVSSTVKGVNLNESATSASDYANAIGLDIKARNDKDDKSFNLVNGTDYTCEYSYVDSDGDALDPDVDKNAAGNAIKVVATITNKNYKTDGTATVNDVKITTDSAKNTVTLIVPIVKKAITNAEITLDKDSFVYTGKTITPEVTVTVDGETLKKDKDYSVRIRGGIDAGTSTVIVTILSGSDYQAGTELTKDFTITKANAEDVTVEVTNAEDIEYDGEAWDGDRVEYEVTLNGVNVKDQFKVTWGENINAGKTAGKITLTPNTKGSNNFEGTKESTFEIKGEKLTGTLNVYNENGTNITDNIPDFAYNGLPITFDTVRFTPENKTGLKEGTDYEIIYVNNTDATTSDSKAYVCVVGKGNYVGEKEIEVDGKVVQDNVIDFVSFDIIGSAFKASDITISNGVYASGLVVKPNVTIVSNGKTLAEGVDYELEYDTSKAIDATEEANIRLTVKGIHGYKGVSIDKDTKGNYLVFGIDKFDLANATVISDGNTITVRNGNVIVPSTEYTSEIADGKVTVTATTANKNYTGSKTVEITEEQIFVGAPVITEVQVNGNKATVILEGEAEGATGYDYVISTVNNYTDGRLSNGINKNQLATQTSYQYLDQGIYYAYCHAWTRDENGNKVFGEWSNIMPFSVSSITPDQPSITKVEKSSNGKHLRVTWTKSANATGYDVVMGTKLQKVNGEYRPVEYGKAVKKVTNGNTVSVIFYNIPKGTYYVGLHAYNRTSETGVKVFSPWSNSKKVTF